MRPRGILLLPILLLAASVRPAIAAYPPPAGIRSVAVLEDPSGSETVETVAAADPARFRTLPEGNLAAGYSRNVHWLRFTVDAPPGEWWLDVLPPYLDDLRLYEPNPERPGRFVEHRAGDHLPFAAREVPYRGFVFKLHVPPGGPRDHYLRVQTTSTAMVLPRLWAPDAFHAAMPGEYGLLLGLIAVLLVFALLNLNSWIWLRERMYLLFFAYLFAMAVAFFGVGGFAAQYLFPDRPDVTDLWVGAATLCSFAAFALWYREILQVTPANRFLHGLGRAVVVVALAGLVAIPLGRYAEVARVVNVLTLLLIGSGLLVAWSRWRAGVAGSAFQLLAVSLSLVAFASSLLTLLGVVPGNFLMLYGPNFAVVGSMVTLHLAISARYRAMHDDRRRAEGEARREREIREQQGKFLDLVTHEYRTPLAVMRTNLDILGLTGDEEERRRSLGRMEGATRRLAEIFDGSLRQGDWGGNRQIALESLDPVPILRDVVEHAADPATGMQPPVEVRGDEGVRVRADRQLLATVFLNLVDNGRKYSPPGAPLEVRIARQGKGAEIRFTNPCAERPGVSTEALSRKYVRGENARGVPGMGVGLHLVRKLLEDQGGTLELGLEPGDRFVAVVTLARGDAGGMG